MRKVKSRTHAAEQLNNLVVPVQGTSDPIPPPSPQSQKWVYVQESLIPDVGLGLFAGSSFGPLEAITAFTFLGNEAVPLRQVWVEQRTRDDGPVALFHTLERHRVGGDESKEEEERFWLLDRSVKSGMGGGSFARDPGPMVQINAQVHWNKKSNQWFLQSIRAIPAGTEIFYRYHPKFQDIHFDLFQQHGWAHWPVFPWSMLADRLGPPLGDDAPRWERSMWNRAQEKLQPDPARPGLTIYDYAYPTLNLDTISWQWEAIEVRESKIPARGRGLFAAMDLPIYTKIPCLGMYVLDFRGRVDWFLEHVFEHPIQHSPPKDSVIKWNEEDHKFLWNQLVHEVVNALERRGDPRVNYLMDLDDEYGVMLDGDTGQTIDNPTTRSLAESLAIASFANEPSPPSEEVNVCSVEGYLVTLKALPKGTEILRCYGHEYKGGYPVHPICQTHHETCNELAKALELVPRWCYKQHFGIREISVRTRAEFFRWLNRGPHPRVKTEEEEKEEEEKKRMIKRPNAGIHFKQVMQQRYNPLICQSEWKDLPTMWRYNQNSGKVRTPLSVNDLMATSSAAAGSVASSGGVDPWGVWVYPEPRPRPAMPPLIPISELYPTQEELHAGVTRDGYLFPVEIQNNGPYVWPALRIDMKTGTVSARIQLKKGTRIPILGKLLFLVSRPDVEDFYAAFPSHQQFEEIQGRTKQNTPNMHLLGDLLAVKDRRYQNLRPRRLGKLSILVDSDPVSNHNGLGIVGWIPHGTDSPNCAIIGHYFVTVRDIKKEETLRFGVASGAGTAGGRAMRMDEYKQRFHVREMEYHGIRDLETWIKENIQQTTIDEESKEMIPLGLYLWNNYFEEAHSREKVLPKMVRVEIPASALSEMHLPTQPAKESKEEIVESQEPRSLEGKYPRRDYESLGEMKFYLRSPPLIPSSRSRSDVDFISLDPEEDRENEPLVRAPFLLSLPASPAPAPAPALLTSSEPSLSEKMATTDPGPSENKKPTTKRTKETPVIPVGAGPDDKFWDPRTRRWWIVREYKEAKAKIYKEKEAYVYGSGSAPAIQEPEVPPPAMTVPRPSEVDRSRSALAIQEPENLPPAMSIPPGVDLDFMSYYPIQDIPEAPRQTFPFDLDPVALDPVASRVLVDSPAPPRKKKKRKEQA